MAGLGGYAVNVRSGSHAHLVSMHVRVGGGGHVQVLVLSGSSSGSAHQAKREGAAFRPPRAWVRLRRVTLEMPSLRLVRFIVVSRVGVGGH